MYSNETAKQFRAILASDPAQAPAILKHLQAVQSSDDRQLRLPRAVLAYELRYGAKPAGLTLAAIRAAIIAPNAANAKAKPSTKTKAVPAKAAAIIGAARSGMIGALVTNLQTARAVLNMLEDGR